MSGGPTGVKAPRCVSGFLDSARGLPGRGTRQMLRKSASQMEWWTQSALAG